MTKTSHTFQHDAFLYRSDREFCDRMARYAGEGLAAGHGVVAAVPAAHGELLRDALGSTADGMTIVPAEDWYRRPPSTIAGFGAIVEGMLSAGAPAVRIIGETVFGAGRREHVEWARYESVLNRLFDASPVSMVCAYDERTLPAAMADAVACTHPHFVRGDGRVPSTDYAEPADFLTAMPAPGPIVDAAVLEEATVESDLGPLRRSVIAAGTEAGLSDERLDEAVLAVNELVTNALLHGLRPVGVRLLADDDHFYCEVRDAGTGIGDPFAGLLPPDEHRVAGGRGLWMAGLLSDGLEIGSVSPGTLARVLFRRSSVTADRP